MHLFWDPYWTVCSSVIYFFEIASITASYCLNSFNKHVNSVNIVNAVNIANIVNIFSNVSGSFETPGFLRSQIFGDPKNICIQEFLNVQKSFEQKLFKKNHQFWYCQFNAKNPSPVNIYIFNPVKVFFFSNSFSTFLSPSRLQKWFSVEQIHIVVLIQLDMTRTVHFNGAPKKFMHTEQISILSEVLQNLHYLVFSTSRPM